MVLTLYTDSGRVLHVELCLFFFFPLVMLSSNSQNPHDYDEESVYYAQDKYGKTIGECFTVSFELSLVCFSSLSSMSMVTWLPCFPGKCSPIYFSIWKHSSHSMYATKYPLLLIMLKGLFPEIMWPHRHTLATC